MFRNILAFKEDDMRKIIFLTLILLIIISSSSAATITLQASSAGFLDPGYAGGIGYLYVDGVNYSVNARGVNLVVIDEISGKVLDSRRYDTFASSSYSNSLVSYINSLQTGRIVLVAVKDEATRYMTSAAINALYSLGASNWQQGYRGSWALIGKVGAGTGNGIQSWHYSGQGPTIVTTTYEFNDAPVTILPNFYNFSYGQNLILDASGSYDPDSGDTITNYAWDLNNDGVIDINTTEALLILSQSEYSAYFNVYGNYVLGLKTTDNNGCTGDFVTTDLILAMPEVNTICLFALSILILFRIKAKHF